METSTFVDKLLKLFNCELSTPIQQCNPCVSGDRRRRLDVQMSKNDIQCIYLSARLSPTPGELAQLSPTPGRVSSLLSAMAS